MTSRSLTISVGSMTDVSLDQARRRMIDASDRVEELCVPWKFFAWRRAREEWFRAYAEHRRVAASIGIDIGPPRGIQRALRRRGLSE